MTFNQPSVFLSHSHEDKAFAGKLARDLGEAGVRVWIDEAEIKLGDSLIAKVSEAIDSVDYLAVVLSPASVESEWVRREVEIALNEEISGEVVKVLPLVVEPCSIPKFLIGRLYADFTSKGSYANGLNVILDKLGLYREQGPARRHASPPLESTQAILRRRADRKQQAEELGEAWAQLAPGFSVNKSGLRNLRDWIAEFSAEEVLAAMEISSEQYLEFDESGDEKVTLESWERAFERIGAICSVRQKSKDNPALQDAYLIRGILRNRHSYVNEGVALSLLKDALANGVPTEELRSIALQSRSWSHFRDQVLELL